MNKSILLAIIGISTFAYGAYTPLKAEAAQYMIKSAWNVANKTGYQVKPWNWMDSHPVIRLKSAKHNQDLIVLEGDTGNVLAFGPGRNIESEHPGRKGTTLISAHRDTHFDFLENVVIGDRFEVDSIYSQDGYQYQVSDIKIIDSDKVDIDISSSQSELKLVTCYPFNAVVAGGSLRYVVTANLVQKS
ncbi:class GN sortase [Candidatus Thioglobus autotrophicus]|uniref:class GN sortase n=1 Tax=Candidatus Thioglobus autotrophicus TaxID=1705394 RepID=UPI00299DE6FA|nr:class GN sortase [Candidatus Thioglobus autotrophicus]WPE18710.1 class GN sortase [Candidatus Thioglobus autotrophicus]